MSYDNTNKGAIWGNDKRESDRHPHFTGKVNVEGVEYYVSAWKRDQGAASNAPALKFSLKKVDKMLDSRTDGGSGIGEYRSNANADGGQRPPTPPQQQYQAPQHQAPPQQMAPPPRAMDDFDDDIPF